MLLPTSASNVRKIARYFTFCPREQVGLLAAVLPPGSRPSIAMAIVLDDCLGTIGATTPQPVPLCNHCKLCKRLCVGNFSVSLQLTQRAKKIENKSSFISSIVRRKVLRMEKEGAISLRLLNKKQFQNFVTNTKNRNDARK